ncbi:MAG: hypothetical protein AAF732_12125 [Pseudomonadota bacterium]
MRFKPEDYLHHLESYDLTLEEKTEFLEALWLIAQCFADQAFGVASVPHSAGSETRTPLGCLIDLDAKEPISGKPANDNGNAQNNKNVA